MSTPDNSLEARVERLELDLAEAVSAITRLSVELEKLQKPNRAIAGPDWNNL